jgi:hypothetical protein
LPDILDPRRIATDEGRDDVLGEIGRDGELATIERSVPDSMDALVGFDFQCDEIAPRTTDDDPAVGYLAESTTAATRQRWPEAAGHSRDLRR